MRVFALIWIASLATFILSSAAVAADIDFQLDVAPILETHCLQCHGGQSTKGAFSVATRADMLEGGDSGPAIEPGDPDSSLFIDQISGDSPAMPRGLDPLSATQVDTLRRWIQQGAPWPAELTLKANTDPYQIWWSLRPLDRPAVPATTTPDWPRTPIDSFIAAGLQAEGLAPRPEADRRTLIRRLAFDLTGLPPSPEEIAAFLADAEPNAYERLVDRLLDSPHYGERWARHWLDIAHYADTHGYDKDKRRDNAWPYRDWVIAALNDDMPYTRFARAQVAGDVLYPDDPAAPIATGFLAAGPWDFVGHVELREGTVEKEKTRLIDRDDMVATTISTFVSQTAHCARCHDHKFDPISQRDYYALQAVFSGVDRGDRPYQFANQAAETDRLQSQIQPLKARRATLDEEISRLTGPDLQTLDEKLATLRAELAPLPPAGDPDDPSPTNGYHSAIEATPDTSKWVQVDLGRPVPIDEIRLIPARPTDFPDTPGFGFPPRFRVELIDPADPTNPHIVADHTAADVPNPGDSWWVERPAGDPAARTAQIVRVTASRLWPRSNDYVFALAEIQVLSGGLNIAARAPITALDTIEAGRWSTGHLVDGFDSRARIDSPAQQPANDHRARLLHSIATTAHQRDALHQALIPSPLRDEHARLNAELADLETALRDQEAPPQVYALVSHAPRPIHLLKRGEVEQPAEPVGPGALSCLPGLPATFTDNADEAHRRADLARWLTAPENVLAWRSIVNRVWHYHFGQGFVDTPSDFGRNGSTPSHPELLDWLAVTFRDDLQGSLKALHRLIVTSAVYRQASTFDEAAATLDASNRLLWRQNRRRLAAEEIRDAVLAVGGTLDPTMGGPGFDLFRFVDDHSPIYDHDDLAYADPPAGRRRAIYRFTVRSVPNPWIDCLDGADPSAGVPVRNETVTPLQALALLNDPFILSQADLLARRLQSQGGSLSAQIATPFEHATGRPPTADETARLAAHAMRLGLPATCRILFNLNEFLYVD